MKRCSYCGAENPDDATVCLIDQKPFDAEGPVPAEKPVRAKASPTKPSRAEIRARMAARPLTVKLAVALLLISEVADFVRVALGHYSFPSHNFDSNVITISTSVFRFCLPPLFIYFAFRGHNWARWTLLFVTVLGLITEPFSFKNLQLDLEICFDSVFDVASMVLLFLPASSQWYKSLKTVSAQPSREDVLAHLSARPWEVKFGIGLLALDAAVEMISEIIYWWPYRRYLSAHFLDPHYVASFIGFVCCLGIYVFLYNCIYRGKNWARWLTSCYFVLANISIPFVYHGGLRWDFYVHSVIELTAVVALFQPSSNNWFKARKKIWNQPVPAA